MMKEREKWDDCQDFKLSQLCGGQHAALEKEKFRELAGFVLPEELKEDMQKRYWNVQVWSSEEMF